MRDPRRIITDSSVYGVVEYLADKNRAKTRVNIGLIFIRWPETGLQMNDNVAKCLLDVKIGNCSPTH